MLKNSEQIKKLMDDAQKLALRWIKAWPSNSYSNVGDVQYNQYTNEITFIANPPSSGIGLRCRIKGKYLDDSKTLEKDSFNWYNEKQKKVENHFSKLKELEELPEIKEYLKLKNTNIHDQVWYDFPSVYINNLVY